jgi:superfamily I DNA/RNA helicase/PHP family Zn ribbon phosphoesterase
MRIIADLHIHSHFSRATSAKLTPPYLERWARIKGINLLGTGDCTHPRWLAELREQLREAEEGLYTLEEGVRADFDAGPALEEGLPKPRGTGGGDLFRFVLTGEISTIYKRGDKTRKVHHLIILPDFRAAASFQTALERIGNTGSDGRPTLGIDSRELLALLLDADERAILIPAHIWTPWFSVLGAKSGFDSIGECYGDLSSRIPAIETGLSSNPPMNWALNSLDPFSIISNSDAHSPDKLGREATIFEMTLSYPSLRAALGRTGETTGNGKAAGEASPEKPETTGSGIAGTIEFFPQEGKYHYDGHRKCGIYLDPEAAASAGGLCPACGKPLTRGVMGRVLELADRPVSEDAACPPGSEKTNRRPYRSLIPLKELLGEILETGTASRKVNAAYAGLIEKTGNELSLLMDMPPETIEKLSCPGLSGELLGRAVARMRSGEVAITPGYDGEYGIIRAFPAGNRDSGKGGELFGGLPRSTRKEPETAPPEPPSRRNRRPLKRIQTPGPPEAAPDKEGGLFVPQEDQAKITAYDGGHALIIAGPGTGKTAVLAARIARLVQEGRDPASILALSFTAKAAAELRDRVILMAGTAGAGAGKVTVSTFHALCASILRENSGERGIPRDFSILDEGTRQALLRELCGELPGKRISPRGLGSYIEARKRFLLLPGEERPKPGSAEPEILASLAGEPGLPEGEPEKEALYERYRNRLRSAASLDFDDLVAGTVRLFAGSRETLLRYRERFRFIFVDEYQDINFSQYALIRLLAPGSSGGTLWVIGDPNQAIYGFRGSDKRFIDRFLMDYPGAARFRLTKSFRCAAPIVNAAGQLMDTPLRGTQSAVSLFRTGYPTEKSEAEGIARRISRLIGGTSFFALDSAVAGNNAAGSDTAGTGTADCGRAGNDAAEELAGLGDCAVLLRTAALAPPIVKALMDHGIPFVLTGELPWWEEEPVKSLLALLRNALYPADGGPPESRLFRDRYLSLNDKSPAELIRLAWEFIPGPVKNKKNPPVPERLYNLASLYKELPPLLDALRISGPGDLPEIKQEGIRIMTIHASKGLEFDHVFVAALEEGLLPFTLYEGENVSGARIEEERRLLYVAMTRAKRGLYLSWAQSRNYQGRKLAGVPSRFLKDLEEQIPLTQAEGPLKRDLQPRLF